MKSIPIISQKLAMTAPQSQGKEVAEATSTFMDVLSSTIDQTNRADIRGEQAINNLHTGKAKNLHEVMLAVEEADIAIRMLVQMRNKAQEAYNEIMRLQI